MTLRLLNATSKETLTSAERLIASGGVECDGQPHVTEYHGTLPHTIIQISVDITNDITSLYAVLRPFD